MQRLFVKALLLVVLTTASANLQPCMAQSWSWGQLQKAALSHMQNGDAAAAESEWRKSIEAISNKDADDPRYVLSMRGLARCLQEQGKLSEAETLYKQLIPNPEKIPASNSELLAAAMEYALVLHKQGKSEAACALDKLLEPTLAEARKVNAPAPTAFAFGGAAPAAEAPKNLKWEAEEGTCLHKPPKEPIRMPAPKVSEADQDEQLPDEDRHQKIVHNDKWQYLSRHGSELLQKEKFAEAEKALRQAYAETRLYHRRDQAHQDIMLDLAAAFAGQGKTAETETMFRLAFLWAKKNTGDVSDETIRVWERYHAALKKLGKQGEAAIAEARYEETLFKLNDARNNGQIHSGFGPITHITEPKSMFDRPPTRRPTGTAGNLYQHPQRMQRFPARYSMQDWFDD